MPMIDENEEKYKKLSNSLSSLHESKYLMIKGNIRWFLLFYMHGVVKNIFYLKIKSHSSQTNVF